MREILQQIARLRVVVIGDLILDHYIWGEATRISPEAPVPIVRVKRDTYAPGGAANVAANVAALGASCEACGLIGDDLPGERLRALLEERGVAFDALHGLTGEIETIQKIRVIAQQQQLCRLDREEPPGRLRYDTPERLAALEARLRDADAIILSDYAKGVVGDPLIRWLQAHRQEAPAAAPRLLALDPHPLNDLAATGLDLLKPNRKEALQMAGLLDKPSNGFPMEAVCRRLMERYQPRRLVITMGPDGIIAAENPHAPATGAADDLPAGSAAPWTIPTAKCEVFDVSGAGDTAMAALTLALAAGAPLDQAARFANCASGVVIGKLGTAVATPAEILARAAG